MVLQVFFADIFPSLGVLTLPPAELSVSCLNMFTADAWETQNESSLCACQYAYCKSDMRCDGFSERLLRIHMCTIVETVVLHVLISSLGRRVMRQRVRRFDDE